MPTASNIEARETRLYRNLWKLFGYSFLSEFWLIAPVLFPYYQAQGLDTEQGLAVQAIYALGVVLFEVPSGYLADRYGRKRALVAGGTIMVLGLVAYAFGTRFWHFAIAEFLLAISGSLRSGTDSALVYDTLQELRREGEYTFHQGRVEMWLRFGTSSAAILGGVFAVFSFKLPFWINVGTGLGMISLSLAMTEPHRRPLAESPWKSIMSVSRRYFKTWRLFRVGAFGALIHASGVIGFWLYVLYYQACGLRLGLYGVMMAAFGLISGMGARASASISEKAGQRFVLATGIVAIPVSFVVLGIWQTYWLIPISWVIGFIWNAIWPVLLTRVNASFTSDRRATALSFFNLLGSLTYASTAPFFGYLVDAYSLKSAFFTLAATLLVGAICTYPGDDVRLESAVVETK